MHLFSAVPLLVLASLMAGCWPWWPAHAGAAHTSLAEVVLKGDALATCDALEALIAEGKDTSADRELALQAVRTPPETPTVEYAFARAAVTGRVIQSRGLSGALLVSDVETWALRSKKLDPTFRDGAAARLLGTLYVLAPAGWLEHGDPELGLELLEGLVRTYPNRLENHLRLAEAYLSLGDPKLAVPYLCRCVAGRAMLRADDQQLLGHLVADAGHPSCLKPRD